MKKILNKTEITKFLDEYCPGTTIEFFTDTIVGHNEDIGLYPSFNGSETSLKCVAYEYAFVKYAREKFEYLEFPMHTYRITYGSNASVEFSLRGQAIQCDAAITLIRDPRKDFELSLNSGLRISGQEHSDYVDSFYHITLSRVAYINHQLPTEHLQEQARELVDEMLNEFTAYELRKD